MGDASWSPLYDLYATSENGMPSKSVSLHYRVNLEQRTGENWRDAKLILSTSATDMLDAGVPASDSLTIQPKEKPRSPPPPPPVSTDTFQRVQRQKYGLDYNRSPPILVGGGPRASRFMSQSLSVPLPPLVQTAAAVLKSPMTVSYAVEEPTTIPSNHLSHKVLVAIIPFEATISHITSPRKSSIVYLQVSIHLSVQLGIERRPCLPFQ